MSKLLPLRAFVNERLSSAVDEIFVLFERTIAEYEEALCRSEKENQRRQQLLNEALLKPGVLLPRAGEEVQIPSPSPPDPAVNQDIPERVQVKEEPEEQSLRHTEEPLTRLVPENNTVSVKTEDSSLLGNTEHKEETQEPDIHSDNTENSSDTDYGDHWNDPIHPADGRMETEAGGDTDKQVQRRNRSSEQDPDWDTAEEKEGREKKKIKRYKEMTLEELDNFVDERDERNTIKTTRWAVKILRDFLSQKNMDINFESYNNATLNDTLRLFYASVLSTGGGEYSIASLTGLRAGINRHLAKVNIITDPEFKSSNLIFKAMCKRCRKSGKSRGCHHPRINESDLETIRCSQALSPDSPMGLVRKVWFDIQLCLARRGREGNREMNMTSFSIHTDQDGIEYVKLSQNERRDCKVSTEPDKKNPGGIMFAKPGDPLCPVKSFKKYISKCPPDAKSFYLHPKRNAFVGSDVWYSKEPMGVNYLGDMLKKICEQVKGLSRIYTNQSLRSTAVSLMSGTGHCCEKSQKGYWAPSVPEQQQQQWINIFPSNNVAAASSSSSQAPQTIYVLQMPM